MPVTICDQYSLKLTFKNFCIEFFQGGRKIEKSYEKRKQNSNKMDVTFIGESNIISRSTYLILFVVNKYFVYV